jgi:tellurite resistance protein
MKRTDLLEEIYFEEASVSNEIEWFQNKYLRSILKFQNNHLIQLCTATCENMNPNFKELSSTEKKRVLQNILQNNQALRMQCVGLITGLLEESEFSWYLNHKSECNKRILTLVEKRVLEY